MDLRTSPSVETRAPPASYGFPGVQMRQAERTAADAVAGYNFEFQTDTVFADKLGGRPTLLAPMAWLD